MRFCKAMFLPGAILIVALGLIWGCGDDDNPVKWGSDDDPLFQAVSAQFNQVIDSTFAGIGESFTSMSTLQGDDNVDPVLYGPGDPNATTDSLTLTYTGGWHILHLAWHNEFGYLAIVNDSVQFAKLGEPQMQGGDIDRLTYRHHWSWAAPDTTVSHIDLNGNSGFDITGLDTDEATIDGTHDFAARVKAVFADSTVDWHFTVESSLSNFTVSKTPVGWAQSCPSEGQWHATITSTYRKDDNPSVEQTWNCQATLENGEIRVIVFCNDYRWTYTREACSL